tara:strand:- start:4802 stop:5017 length:216 start_codon:yes stop_codon:yes gene_type:complete
MNVYRVPIIETYFRRNLNNKISDVIIVDAGSENEAISMVLKHSSKMIPKPDKVDIGDIIEYKERSKFDGYA